MNVRTSKQVDDIVRIMKCCVFTPMSVDTYGVLTFKKWNWKITIIRGVPEDIGRDENKEYLVFVRDYRQEDELTKILRDKIEDMPVWANNVLMIKNNMAVMKYTL